MTKSYFSPVRPYLDKNSGTGARDYGGISFYKNGKSFALALNNIREWTSYSLRNYYKKHLIQ